MSYEKLSSKKSENQEQFEKIKTPAELLSYMKANMKYGFVGKNDHKLYSSDDEENWKNTKEEDYYLQTPEELLESLHGECWAQTELERSWFLKNGYEFKTFLMMFSREISQKNPAHAFLAYKDKDSNKWCWIENTFGDNDGIHEFDTIELLLNEVEKIIKAIAKRNAAIDEDQGQFKCLEYDTPEFGIGTQEFLDNALNKKKLSSIQSESELKKYEASVRAQKEKDTEDYRVILEEIKSIK